MEVLRDDERLARLVWPDVEVAGALEMDRGDALIACGGFEERALAQLKAAVEGGSRGFRVIGVSYRPAIAQNKMTEIEDLVRGADALLSWVPYDRYDPSGAASLI